MDTLTREQRADVISRAIAWARLATPDIPRALAPVDDTGSRMNHLALAVCLLEDGRRMAVQALDAAREYIETVSGNPDELVGGEVVRVCTYAAHRLDGSLATGLDPELMASEERVAICHRAFEIAGAALDRLDAEHPELVTDVDVLSAALSLTSERLVAVASKPRVTRCTWCDLTVPAAGDAWLKHSLECEKSPTALCYRYLNETLRRTLKSGSTSLTAHEQLEVIRDACTDVLGDAAALLTAAENDRLLRETQGQQHEADCPDPLSPHATCEESTATPEECREWERDRQPEQRVARISKAEFDAIPKQLVTERLPDTAPSRCDECDPSFTTCFSDPDKCVKRPPPAAFEDRFDDQVTERRPPRPIQVDAAIRLCRDLDALVSHPHTGDRVHAYVRRDWLIECLRVVGVRGPAIADWYEFRYLRAGDADRLRNFRYLALGQHTPVDDELDRLLGPWSEDEAERLAKTIRDCVTFVHSNPLLDDRRRTYASYDQAALAVAHATHLPADQVRLDLGTTGVQLGADTWRIER